MRSMPGSMAPMAPSSKSPNGRAWFESTQVVFACDEAGEPRLNRGVGSRRAGSEHPLSMKEGRVSSGFASPSQGVRGACRSEGLVAGEHVP
jgi:hypothetical protein